MNIYDKTFTVIGVVFVVIGAILYYGGTVEGKFLVLGVTIGILLTIICLWLGHLSASDHKDAQS